MKATLTSAFSILFAAGIAAAQGQEPVQPTIGVVAVIHEGDRANISMRLANELTTGIGKQKGLYLKTQTIPLHTEHVGDSALVEAAHGKGVNWLAIVDYEPGNQSRGAFTVELARASADKIISRTAIVIGVLIAEEERLRVQIPSIVSNCLGGISAILGQNATIRVFLDLCVKPGKADYVLGKSDIRSTNDLGLDRWETSLPVGKSILKVMKSGFSDANVPIDVPWTSEIFVIRRIVDLRP